MHGRTRSILIFLLALVFTVPGTALAAVDAEAVVSGKCTACHSAERIRESSKTKAEWKSLVDDEIDRGAQLSRSERTVVVDWLAENYGVAAAEEVVEAEEVEAEEVEAPVETAEAEAETNTAAVEESLPFDQQAETGIELWHFLLTGGALISGGTWMRRR